MAGSLMIQYDHTVLYLLRWPLERPTRPGCPGREASGDSFATTADERLILGSDYHIEGGVDTEFSVDFRGLSPM